MVDEKGDQERASEICGKLTRKMLLKFVFPDVNQRKEGTEVKTERRVVPGIHTKYFMKISSRTMYSFNLQLTDTFF